MRPCGKPLACYFLLRPFATANNGLAKGTQRESHIVIRKAQFLFSFVIFIKFIDLQIHKL